MVLLDEFLYKIGFDVDSGKIKQIEQGLKNISSLAKQTAQPISDWAKSGEDNWRFKLLDFLSNLTFDEIEIIKNRSKK